MHRSRAAVASAPPHCPGGTAKRRWHIGTPFASLASVDSPSRSMWIVSLIVGVGLAACGQTGPDAERPPSIGAQSANGAHREQISVRSAFDVSRDGREGGAGNQGAAGASDPGASGLGQGGVGGFGIDGFGAFAGFGSLLDPSLPTADPTNSPPVASFSVEPPCVDEPTDAVVLTSTSVDPDGDALLCAFSMSAGLPPISDACTVGAEFVVGEPQPVTLSVSDGRGGVDTVTMDVGPCPSP
jgi:hypothetical protein